MSVVPEQLMCKPAQFCAHPGTSGGDVIPLDHRRSDGGHQPEKHETSPVQDQTFAGAARLTREGGKGRARGQVLRPPSRMLPSCFSGPDASQLKKLRRRSSPRTCYGTANVHACLFQVLLHHCAASLSATASTKTWPPSNRFAGPGDGQNFANGFLK